MHCATGKYLPRVWHTPVTECIPMGTQGCPVISNEISALLQVPPSYILLLPIIPTWMIVLSSDLQLSNLNVPTCPCHWFGCIQEVCTNRFQNTGWGGRGGVQSLTQKSDPNLNLLPDNYRKLSKNSNAVLTKYIILSSKHPAACSDRISEASRLYV
jgi:hypothetical protein